MSMIFQFRALSDENDNFVRDYELQYNSTLLDFHNCICDDLGFDMQVMASFFLSDQQWDKLDEYTLADMGLPEEEGPKAMGDVTLDRIMTENGDRLIYMFDILTGRSLYIELMGTYRMTDGTDYPNVKFSSGEAPLQFDPTTEGKLSIFEEAMGEFGSFEGDDNYQDDEF